jgi:hypothetical protein
MEIRLRELLLDYCLAHLDQLTSHNLGVMARLAAANLPGCLFSKVLLLQQSLLQRNIIHSLAPNTLGRYGQCFGSGSAYERGFETLDSGIVVAMATCKNLIRF